MVIEHLTVGRDREGKPAVAICDLLLIAAVGFHLPDVGVARAVRGKEYRAAVRRCHGSQVILWRICKLPFFAAVSVDAPNVDIARASGRDEKLSVGPESHGNGVSKNLSRSNLLVS